MTIRLFYQDTPENYRGADWKGCHLSEARVTLKGWQMNIKWLYVDVTHIAAQEKGRMTRKKNTENFFKLNPFLHPMPCSTH